MNLPLVTGGFDEQMRFLQCGQSFRCVCEYCDTVSRSDEWHQCDARTTAVMKGNESYYQAYRAKLGTRDNWTGD